MEFFSCGCFVIGTTAVLVLSIILGLAKKLWVKIKEVFKGILD
jgi:hypothetical protein